MNCFDELKTRLDILKALRPLFYDFKETLFIIGYRDLMSFQELYRNFYNISREMIMIQRYFPKDEIWKNLNNKSKHHYFMSVANHYNILNEIKDLNNLENEIVIIENKIDEIRIFNRNRYIIFLLSCRIF